MLLLPCSEDDRQELGGLDFIVEVDGDRGLGSLRPWLGLAQVVGGNRLKAEDAITQTQAGIVKACAELVPGKVCHAVQLPPLN